MKGVILAGGMGTRLHPLTKITNKHLLPVAGNFMITYPLATLLNAGIRDILIVTGKENCGDFMKLLGSGADFGCKFTYRIQDEAGGIAHALLLAEDFAAGKPVTVILGDNYFEDNVSGHIRDFKGGAKVFLKEVDDAHRFGVAEVRGNKVVGIEEKPKSPKSDYAVTGLYAYDADVFSVIKSLKPSARGELEITDVNNAYIRRNLLSFAVLDGFWSDMGTPESLHRAAVHILGKK